MRFNQFKEIYKLFWPIAISMFLTSMLSFIDSAMLANYNINAVSAISIAVQPQSIFGPVLFGVLTGVTIYSVQYYARGEYDVLKKLSGVAITIIIPLALFNFMIMAFFSIQLTGLFVPKTTEIYQMTIDYMNIFKYSILLFPINMFFIQQYRAIKRPKIGLYVSFFESCLNIIFNLLLIYGFGPLHEFGIAGAAMGTFLSRACTLSLNIYLAKKLDVPFVGTIKKIFSYNKTLFSSVFYNMLPLVIVELGFGLGNVIYTKIYSMTSLEEFTAYNIAKTTSFIINAFVIATANVSAVMLGSVISKGYGKDSEELKDTTRNMFTFMFVSSIVILILTVFVLPLIIPVYGVNGDMLNLILKLMYVNGIWMALRVFASSFIAILKSGNDNRFVILVDAGSTFLVGVPLAIYAIIFLNPGIVLLRSIIIIEVITKILFGLYRYKQYKWVKKI